MTSPDLSPQLKRALLVLLRDRFIRQGQSGWCGKSNQVIHHNTIRLLEGRRLIEMQLHAQGFVRAKLTDIGRFLAIKCEDEAPHLLAPAISEASAQFIAEVVS